MQYAVSESVLFAYFYIIKWNQDVNMRSNLCEGEILHMLIEGARRILCKSIQKKQQITTDIMQKVVDHLAISNVRLCNVF